MSGDARPDGSLRHRLGMAVATLVGGSVDGRALALFRMGLACSVWFEARQNVWRLDQYTPNQLHVPLLGLPLDGFDLDTGWQLCAWQMRAALFLFFGLGGRVAAVVALLAQGALFGVSALNFQNHVYLMLVLLALVSTSQCDAAWSVRSLLRRARGAARVPALPVRLIQAQILIIYLYTGLHKAALGFADGYALCRFLGRDLPRSPLAGWLSPQGPWPQPGFAEWVSTALGSAACGEHVPTFVVAGAVGTIVAELGLAAGLAWRRSVWVGVIVGLGLHATIYASMSVVTFGAMMVSTYPLFIAAPWVGARSPRGR
ncbi:MAG: HTTM domain-containing protein [Myxococcales bacterium]|nr:HTTM domain-containing protein [Myxococcales bacterium]MCB9530949.1 HTTM domain-containing protein [Myxococcales bacterium]MCB9532868.1 HTTM domain-containing protein [Myxococcales bacterium]